MIDDFKATLGKRGFAKPTFFRMEITNVPSLVMNTAGTSEILKDLHFFAETAEFPGTQILTQEHRYYDMPAKFAYGKAHDELNITFRLDRDYQVKKIFDIWVNSVYDRNTGNINYKNGYVGVVQIYQVMENGVSSYAVELEEVFPTQIGQISLGWDQSGTYARLPVTLTFKRMKTVANKQLFRKKSAFGSSGLGKGGIGALGDLANGLTDTLNDLTGRIGNVLGGLTGDLGGGLMNVERIIDEPMNRLKSEVTQMVDGGMNAIKQFTVMDKTSLGGLFGGIDFV